MINKVVILVITRIIEFVVLALFSRWIWQAAADAPGYRLFFLFSVIAAYCVYLGVTLSNDYKELKCGEGEPLQ